MMKQFLSFVRKEFYHIFRDKRTMLILLAMPVILIILFGYAITTEVKDCRVAVLDLSKDEITSQIKEHIAANRYFTLTQELENIQKGYQLFAQGDIDMVVTFSEQFSANIKADGTAAIQILTDGSEPNLASVRTGYMQQILAAYAQEYAEKHALRPAFSITPVTRMLYNPQSKSEYNFVPGVIGLILMLICAMMTSVSIVREKEMGTMEILLASPLPPLVIVTAKLIPYFFISCLNLATILLLSSLLLHIPIAGSLPVFIGITLLYIFVALLLGLFISTLANNQLAAMLVSLLLIVPTVYLSGVMFPVESMPVILQKLSFIVPARWYIEAARKLMIQGVETRYIVEETLVLSGMALILLGVSRKLFKTRLE